jgi:hypothetical protein
VALFVRRAFLNGGDAMNELIDQYKPVQVFRDHDEASVAASIWCRNSRKGIWYDVTFARAYPRSESEVGYSQSFGDRHLDAVIRVARTAQAWIAEKKANATICRGAADENEDPHLADEAA